MQSGIPFEAWAIAEGIDFSALSSLIAAFAPVAVVAFWCAVLFLMSRLSGWSRLAERYAATGAVPANLHRFRSAKVGWAGYNNCLTVGGDMRGLYLAMFPIFRPGHTPLYIPWHDVEATAGSAWIIPYVDLRFRQFPDIQVRLPRALAEAVVGESAGNAVIREDESTESAEVRSSIKSIFASRT